MKRNCTNDWSGGKLIIEICGFLESIGRQVLRDIHLYEICASKFKESTMFPFGYSILLGCMLTSGLIDNATISTKKAK